MGKNAYQIGRNPTSSSGNAYSSLYFRGHHSFHASYQFGKGTSTQVIILLLEIILFGMGNTVMIMLLAIFKAMKCESGSLVKNVMACFCYPELLYASMVVNEKEVKMLMHLEATDPDYLDVINDGPYMPTKLVPATPTVAEHYQLKEKSECTPEEKVAVLKDVKVRNILHNSLDSVMSNRVIAYKTSKEI
ncbi:hypothetical protein AgCh_006301 [Apium graveolens]